MLRDGVIQRGLWIRKKEGGEGVQIQDIKILKDISLLFSA